MVAAFVHGSAGKRFRSETLHNKKDKQSYWENNKNLYVLSRALMESEMGARGTHM